MQSDFEKNLKILEQNRNILVLGSGGTGKSTLIRAFIERHPELKIITCAPTHTAAINIEGTTVHQLFSVPIPAYGRNLSDVPKYTIDTLRKADIVIIDEISMCRNDTFAFATKVLAKVNRMKKKRTRLICCGDFYQLPPVVKKNEQKLMKRFGLDISGFPFTTKEWADLKFRVVELTKIYRQDNREMIENLNKIRDGDTSGLWYFDRFTTAKKELPSEEVICICGTNAEADKINTERINQLSSLPVAYQATTIGRVTNLPVDRLIMLKTEERVMFTANDYCADSKFQNGLMGTIVSTYCDHVVVRTDDGREVVVWPYTWKLYTYRADGTSLIKKEVGEISQIPLRPAWAITIHKAQGKTFDRAVIAPKSFAPGQLYVALSRVTSPEGLFLTESIKDEYVKTSPEVIRFIKNKYEWENARAMKMPSGSKKKKSSKRTAARSSSKKQKTKSRTKGTHQKKNGVTAISG